MTTTDEITRVRSRDGTEIAYWSSGTGPPLVLVHGATADHTRWQPVLAHLEPHVTVHAVDRRGRGGSGDAPEYTIEREYEDVAAVIDALAQETGGPVDLLGHSYGGQCALGAATLTAHLGRLLLYEPAESADDPFPSDLLERLEGLLAEDRREELLAAFFREAVMMPDHELAVFRSLPAWRARLASAHTLPRELRTVAVGTVYDPARVATITAPTLLLLGGDSPAGVKRATERLAETIPNAQIAVLDGQQHIAIDLDPMGFSGQVLDFLRDGAPTP